MSCGVTSGGIDDRASAVFPSAIIGVGGDKSSGHGIDRIPIELLAKECDLRSGSYRIVYSSTEVVIKHQGWREMLLKSPSFDNIAAIATDKAHCMSKWYEVLANDNESKQKKYFMTPPSRSFLKFFYVPGDTQCRVSCSYWYPK